MRANEGDLRVEAVMKCLQQFVRRRMHRRQLGQLLLRRLGRIDLLRHPRKLRLVLVQVVIANLQQAIQRNIDHLVIRKRLRERVRAIAEVAIRARQQVCLHPRAIALQRINDRRIALREVRLGLRIGGGRRRRSAHRSGRS